MWLRKQEIFTLALIFIVDQNFPELGNHNTFIVLYCILKVKNKIKLGRKDRVEENDVSLYNDFFFFFFYFQHDKTLFWHFNKYFALQQ